MRAQVLRVASLAFAAAAAAVLFLPAAPAAGAAPTAVGWWQRALTEPASGDALLPPAPAPARPTAVAVPDGGLYVANDASGPRAVSALRFPAGRGRGVLTLRLSGEPLLPLGARLVACAVGGPWSPAADGAWAKRPDLRCASAVTGAFVEDRTAVQFTFDDLNAVATADGIEIGVAPAAGETATFAIAFAPPGPDALAAPAPPPSAAPVTAAVDDGVPVAAPVLDAPVVPRPAPGLAPSASPGAVVDQALEVETRPRARAAATTAGVHIGTDGPARAAITALLSLLAASAWVASGGLPRWRGRRVDVEGAP